MPPRRSLPPATRGVWRRGRRLLLQVGRVGVHQRLHQRGLRARVVHPPLVRRGGQPEARCPAHEARRRSVAPAPRVHAHAADGSATESHVFRLPGSVGRVAIIDAYTRSLCAACNRIRLTADGRILNCLYAADGVDLRTLIRRPETNNSDLARALKGEMLEKMADGWLAQKAAAKRTRTSMTLIGG